MKQIADEFIMSDDELENVVTLEDLEEEPITDVSDRCVALFRSGTR